MLADWQPTASLANLRLRAELLKQVRALFDARGFLEVETPLLCADTVIDAHIDPLSVTLAQAGRHDPSACRLWLQTSPEQCMKRLLAFGAEAIYQISRAFRAGEGGPWHNPEFTLVEWYRVGDGTQEGIALLSAVAEELLGRGAAEQLSYGAAFQQHAGVDPLRATEDDFVAAARRHEVPIPPPAKGDAAAVDEQAKLDAWRELLLVEVVAPRLGRNTPTIVHDFPASQAALAQMRAGDPPVAERFELFVDGLELANGYHELLDADELIERGERANHIRTSLGKQQLPRPQKLLDAMRHGMPAASGCALGFDRLVALVAGAGKLADVWPFPTDRA